MYEWWNGSLTPNSAELASGSLTGVTSMKLNAFHCDSVSCVLGDCISDATY
jgi:hypothetical protein